MCVGHHHDVPRGIGIAIQDHEILAAAEDNQGLRIVMSLGSSAKNATAVFHGPGNILIPPGRPEIIHGWRRLLSRRLRRYSCSSRSGIAVYEILKFFAGLEERNALRGDFYLGACLRI